MTELRAIDRGTLQLSTDEHIVHIEIDSKEIQLRVEDHMANGKMPSISVYIYYVEDHPVDEMDDTEWEIDGYSATLEEQESWGDGGIISFQISETSIREGVASWIDLYEEVYMQ